MIPMTMTSTMKLAVPLGAGVIAQQVIDPLNPGIFERLGTFSIVAIVGYYIIKYLTGQNEKKDERIVAMQDAHVRAIQTMHAEQIASNAAHTVMLVDELRESRSGRDRLNETLSQLQRSQETLTREVIASKAPARAS